MEQAKLKDKPSLRLERSYPVPPEKVWQAWTDPQALKQWFGPGPGEPVSLAQFDVRVGHQQGWSGAFAKLERFLQEK